jgi:DNA-binding transcriptional ArsR family regulator
VVVARADYRSQPVTTSQDQPPRERLEMTAALLQALAYPPRLEIVLALRRQESTPTALGARLPMTQTVISHHLRHLKMVGVLRRRRQGSFVVYSIAPGVDALLRAALAWSLGSEADPDE